MRPEWLARSSLSSQTSLPRERQRGMWYTWYSFGMPYPPSHPAYHIINTVAGLKRLYCSSLFSLSHSQVWELSGLRVSRVSCIWLRFERNILEWLVFWSMEPFPWLYQITLSALSTGRGPLPHKWCAWCVPVLDLSHQHRPRKRGLCHRSAHVRFHLNVKCGYITGLVHKIKEGRCGHLRARSGVTWLIPPSRKEIQLRGQRYLAKQKLRLQSVATVTESDEGRKRLWQTWGCHLRTHQHRQSWIDTLE